MLRYALVSALLLLGLPATADEDKTLKKSEVKQVIFYKDNVIEFELHDGSFYEGQILTPDCLRGKKSFENRNVIKNTYKVYSTYGFKTCRFSDLVERIAWRGYSKNLISLWNEIGSIRFVINFYIKKKYLFFHKKVCYNV